MPTDPRGARRDELLDHLLVLRCQAGDEAAFRRLFEQFRPRTLRYLAGLVGDDAEDVQQDVWLTVYRRLGQLADPGAFVPWLYGVTRHRAIDFLRRRRRERELLEGFATERLAGGDAADAAEADAAGAWEGAVLPDAVGALPPALREVLQLRYRDGLSYGDIALVVGCAVGTVRSRLHNAKRRLQQVLEQEQERERGPADGAPAGNPSTRGRES